MNKQISLLIKIILFILIGAGILLSITWLPTFINYIKEFSINSDWVSYTICAVIAIPVFIVLILGFYFPYAIKNDMIFNIKTAKILNIIALILLFDCTAFGIFNAYILFTGEKLLAPALLFVALIGVTVGTVLLILSSYIKKATLLKEEVDATL